MFFERITKKIKNCLVNSVMNKLIFLSQKKIIVKLKSKIIFVLMCFVMTID